LSFQPKSREGWLLIALHLALVITWADVLIKDQTEDTTRVLWFVGIVLAQTALLILIAYRTSEQVS
jgi:hypothetical protein